MSPACLQHADNERRFPRVSGDEPKVVLVSEGSQEFSPRERG